METSSVTYSTTPEYTVHTQSAGENEGNSTGNAASTDGGQDEVLLCEKIEFVIAGLLVGVLCIFGLIGNTLSMMTFWSTIKKNATSFVLTALALCDDGVCVIWFISMSCKQFIKLAGHRNYSIHEQQYLNLYVWPIGSFFHLAGSWMVALVTFHRYVAVCHPHVVNKYANIHRAKIQVLVITVAALIINIPRVISRYPVLAGDGITIIRKESFDHFEIYYYIYEVVIYLLLIFIIPFIALTVMTYKIVSTLQKTKQKREQMTRSKQDELDLTTTLIVVVVVFMVCQIGNPIRRLLSISIASRYNTCGTFSYFWSSLSSVLIVFNACGNFVIYCIFSRRFRKTLKRKVFGCRRKVDPMDASYSTALNASINPASN